MLAVCVVLGVISVVVGMLTVSRQVQVCRDFESTRPSIIPNLVFCANDPVLATTSAMSKSWYVFVLPSCEQATPLVGIRYMEKIFCIIYHGNLKSQELDKHITRA